MSWKSFAWLRAGVWLALVVLGCGVARADAVLMIEEPINFLGHLSATGHSAVYLDGVCTDDHVSVRVCRAGETGSVVSRYKGIGGYDWVAMEPEPYLYALGPGQVVPAKVTEAEVDALRDAYRDEHLGKLTAGSKEAYWIQLVGTAYRRRVLCLRMETTAAQDRRAVRWLNARRNKSHFNFFLANCADFDRQLLNAMFPHAVRRSWIFDAGMTTPKQLASQMHKYAERHPELRARVEVIDQVPGELPRSGKVYGVTESFAKTKPYLLPLAWLQPEGIGTVTVVGLCDRRYSLQAQEAGAPRVTALPQPDDPVAALGTR